MWIATAAECHEMDRQAETMGVSVESLMREAGRSLAACVLEEYPQAKRITLYCGKGNNGGDGMVAARLLAEHQRKVEVWVAAPEESLAKHARRECSRLPEVGIRPRFAPFSEESSFPCDIVVDALLGTGADGPPSGEIAEAIERINMSARPVIAADIPSGVLCDSGAAPGIAVAAERTVTFGLPKPFLFLGQGIELSGRWTVAPIGLPDSLLGSPRSARLFGQADAVRLMPHRSKGAHKGSEGHVLIVAGHDDMPGAAVLCARGALRAGAGLVTVAATRSVCEKVAAHLPEAILIPLPDEDGRLGSRAAGSVLTALRKANGAVFGPGLGNRPAVGSFLSAVFPSLCVPTVLDADALNLVAGGVPLPPGDAVLTPHPGEAGRLLLGSATTVQEGRFQSARKLADTTGKTVLLKGAHSVAASPGAPLSVNPTGNPAMAGPGMGDVLSGVVGALLAKGLTPHDAATLGAYWHGLAGDICREEIGPAGILASEIAEVLPRARATIAAS